MLRTLRNRLVLSHALPLLIVVPLMGIWLIYSLETQYVIPSLSRNLQEDAHLIADLARDYPEIWTDSPLAGDLLQRLKQGGFERIMLITNQGILLGSTDPADLARLQHSLEVPGLDRVLRGETVTTTHFSAQLEGEVIDVVAPVMDSNGGVAGIVRLTYHFETFYEEFVSLRYLIGFILIISLVVGIGLGSLLAVSISRPIQKVTQAVYDLASGRRSEVLREYGPREIRQLQEAANHLVQRLHSMEIARRKLLANLVHELGRPLGALRAAIQALLRGGKDDPALLNELLEGMDQEALLLQHLTEELSDLHEQILGPLELDTHDLDLSIWLPPVLAAWQAAAEEKRLYWHAQVSQNLGVIRADPERLSQSLGNLLSNAIKYTPAGGQISVASGEAQNEVWIQVADTGAGIPAEELDRVFEPFYRGNQTGRFPRGMGLGLSIARDLVVAQGGRITVESKPGEGSKFTIWLPCLRSA